MPAKECWVKKINNYKMSYEIPQKDAVMISLTGKRKNKRRVWRCSQLQSIFHVY